MLVSASSSRRLDHHRHHHGPGISAQQRTTPPPSESLTLFLPLYRHPPITREHPSLRLRLSARRFYPAKMVQLTEVVDEHFKEGQRGPEEDEEEDFTDTGM